MKKWIALLLAGILSLAGYVVAGPYITVRHIRAAAQAQDAAALSEQVDFPALRASLKAQLQDRMLRKIGPEAQANPFAAFGMTIANGLAGAGVDAMVTPAGLGALMEGHKIWKRAGDGVASRDPASPATDPLQDARYRYESLSRFTATVVNREGEPVVFVMTRHGLRWKLSDIRLPH